MSFRKFYDFSSFRTRNHIFTLKHKRRPWMTSSEDHFSQNQTWRVCFPCLFSFPNNISKCNEKKSSYKTFSMHLHNIHWDTFVGLVVGDTIRGKKRGGTCHLSCKLSFQLKTAGKLWSGYLESRRETRGRPEVLKM